MDNKSLEQAIIKFNPLKFLVHTAATLLTGSQNEEQVLRWLYFDRDYSVNAQYPVYAFL